MLHPCQRNNIVTCSLPDCLSHFSSAGAHLFSTVPSRLSWYCHPFWQNTCTQLSYLEQILTAVCLFLALSTDVESLSSPQLESSLNWPPLFVKVASPAAQSLFSLDVDARGRSSWVYGQGRDPVSRSKNATTVWMLVYTRGWPRRWEVKPSKLNHIIYLFQSISHIPGAKALSLVFGAKVHSAGPNF